jgi:beta-mannanase
MTKTRIRCMNIKRIFFCVLLLALNATLIAPTRSSAAIDSVTSVPAMASAMMGIFVQDWLDQTFVDTELIPLDTWAGKHTTLVGFSADFEDPGQFLGNQLDVLWNNGYTPYIDLTAGSYSQPTAYEIASGQKDAALNHWAGVYSVWALSGKFAFISVLPEMNTPYVSYGRDPANYKLAFARIRQIFSQNGVPDSAVRWVFAPNGWVQLPFEPYYPGEDLVDVVGYSALNQGLCPSSMVNYWLTPDETVGFSLKEMHAMAPEKPIFVTRLGTTAYAAAGYSDAAKNQWLRDTYSALADDPNVRAVIYNNFRQSTWNCDWAVYSTAYSIQYTGYHDAVQDSRYGYMTPAQLQNADLEPVEGRVKTYIPLIIASNNQPVLLGSYTQEWPGTQKVMDLESHAVEAWSGKRLSLAGTFIDIYSDPVNNIEMQLETLWDNGYTPFINLDVLYNSGITSKMIADGYSDTVLHIVARTYATMVQYNHEMAFFAPLQEMNGDWVSYGSDPANFILAYRRIQQIFSEEGVPPESIRWVFAPNGWNAPVNPPFEDYYPGDAYVDILAFSGYNFGYCAYSSHPAWETPDIVYDQFIHRLEALSPAKPIFIAQTATTSITKQGKNVAVKNQWLADTYNYLAAHPVVRAVIYYNRWNAECDWSFYQFGGEAYTGYQQGVANPVFGYISPIGLQNIIFSWP